MHIIYIIDMYSSLHYFHMCINVPTKQVYTYIIYTEHYTKHTGLIGVGMKERRLFLFLGVSGTA